MSPLRRVILVSHTHWDREWYLPFEDFRLLLVKTLDQLIDLMEMNPEYRRFNLDGQTIVLDDYIQLRPENQARLKKLISQGRIQIGPWYVLADEFLVSGESLIRNLLYGQQTAQEFGDVMLIGYVPDTFGHITQLPQILCGFDIHTSVWWRGLEDHGKTLPTELRWQAPDGSEVLLVHLRTSYSTAANLPNSVDAALAQLLMPLNLLSLRGTSTAVLLMNGSDHLPPQPFLPDLLKAINQRLQSQDILKGKTASQLLSDYGKSPLDKEVTGITELSPFIDSLFANFIKELKGTTFQHGTLKDYLDIIQQEVNITGLPVIIGEQHASKYVPVLPGVFSARLYLKQQNFATQQLLERWVEPFATIASWLGAPYPTMPLRRAWKLLLQNHPHDSICGCSIDATHADMERRFAWSQQIGYQLLSEAIHHINCKSSSNLLSQIPASFIVAFRVFNPQPWETTDIIRLLLQLPTPLKSKFKLALYNADGEKIPSQIMKVQALDPALHSLVTSHTLPQIYTGEPQIPDPARQILLTFSVPEIPGLGYSTFYLATDDRTTTQTPPLSVRQEGDVYTIDNSFIQLQASTLTGTLSLHHKPTQKHYSPLLVFEDTGDIGDEYNYCPPAHDLRVTSANTHKAKIRILEQGPITVTLEITTPLSVPKSVHKNREERSSQRRRIPIQTLVTVSAYSSRIDVQTIFINTAEDHRLRVLFPTNIQTNTAWGTTPFHVTERPLTPAPQEWGAQLYPLMIDYYLTSILKQPNVPGKPQGWFEDSTSTHALQTFLDVNDGTRGLLIATRGLPEYEVLNDANRTIALTLLRSVGWLSRPDLTTRRGHAGPELPTPGAQCRRRHVAHYSILPHQGSWKNTSTLRQTQSYITPLKAIQLARIQDGNLPPSHSFLSINNTTCSFSCLKKAEGNDSTILRIYEICGEPAAVRIQSSMRITKASSVDLAEQSRHSSPIKLLNPNVVPVKVSPYQIRTLQLQVGSPLTETTSK
jgi:mannosylglycerate hydrolase